jgi:tRNA(Ile)-lysidine synthase
MGPSQPVAAVRHAVRAALADVSATARSGGALVLAACSGGPDSVALAAALAFEAARCSAPLRAGGVTVDHGLQPGSAKRAADVVELLARLGLDPVECATVEVAGEGGPEAAARRARYTALDAVAGRLGAAAVLLGHTLDDQAETVLLGLARGSGLRSIAGMPARFGPDARYRRPLLGLSRATTRAACAEAGLPVWDDPHNTDPAFARARVRADVLPALEAALGPGVAAALARTADLARDDADALDQWAVTVTAEIGGTPATGVDVAGLAGLPAAVRRRVLRQLAVAAGVPAGSLAAVHLQEVERLVSEWHGQGPVSLPGRLRATRRCGRLYLEPDPHTAQG